MSRTVIVSIGYEGRSLEGLIEILLGHGVEKLLDIREAPVSRKRGFSKQALAARLDEAGIEYRHLRLAGNPYRQIKQDIQRCLQLYETHLCENPHVVETVAEELRGGAVAVLCYERLHKLCHRSVLLAALVEEGDPFEVVYVE